MNRDILNIILNDVLYNDINSIKKTSLICKNIHNNIQILAQTDEIKGKLCILHEYDPNESIYEAARCGDIDIVQLMIGKGVQRSMNWNWAMCLAAEGGHMNIVQLIIEKGAQRSINWNNAMIRAASCGHMNIVQLMIEKGANYWCCDEAIYYATHDGHTDIVELLKQYQANKKI